MTERLAAIAHFLVCGVAMQQIVNYAQSTWGVRRRMTQLYIQRVKEHWAEAASKEDYLAHLWLAKLQRERLIGEIFKDLDKSDDPKVRVSLLRAAHPHMKERDELMASVLEHRQRAKRDASPDSEQAGNERMGMVVMPMNELMERFDEYKRLINLQAENIARWRHYDPLRSPEANAAAERARKEFEEGGREAIAERELREWEEEERRRQELLATPLEPPMEWVI
jgi:hypothetical protein